MGVRRYLILTLVGLLSAAGDRGDIMEHIERNDRIKSNGHKKSLTHSADGIIEYFSIIEYITFINCFGLITKHCSLYFYGMNKISC